MLPSSNCFFLFLSCATGGRGRPVQAQVPGHSSRARVPVAARSHGEAHHVGPPQREPESGVQCGVD